ncbi:MBL fold metallo-hydrolase [Pseudonocardia sp. GCM10023141]|uniref:MBL fold metallo-hydrolase n=1 Tax=Pseudonocardia sp. GCM10023141 TaxID=3252653 RepID=UPI00360738DD
MRWIVLADGVFARRHVELDLTLGLVVGSERCLVIDTGTDEVHGAVFAAAVRAITPLPWTVVITHAHWDHFLGTGAFLPAPVYAHPRCGEVITADGAAQVTEWAQRYRAEGKPELAGRLEGARRLLPDRAVDPTVALDLGGRTVTLIHADRGHTDHDVLVHVPDAAVVFAGDTVEQGASPSVGPDSALAAWPALLDAVLDLAPGVVVPGHGEPVDVAFVRTQRAELATVAALAADVGRGVLTVEQAIARSPWPAEATGQAIHATAS